MGSPIAEVSDGGLLVNSTTAVAPGASTLTVSTAKPSASLTVTMQVTGKPNHRHCRRIACIVGCLEGHTQCSATQTMPTHYHYSENARAGSMTTLIPLFSTSERLALNCSLDWL